MESRFRVKFWPSRRAKRNSDLESHSISYQTAPEGKRQPIFIHQPLGRNLKEKRKSEILALQGVSYRTSRAGTPPEMGEFPHKGNGPVKLHASHRTSTGELVTTSGNESVLDGMRDSQVFVPRSSYRNSTSNDRRPSHSSLSSSPSQRRPPGSAPATWAPFSGSSPLIDIPENSPAHLTVRNSVASPNSPSLAESLKRPTSQQQSPPVEGLGIHPSILKNSNHYVETPPAEQNATIRALWKAEYSRLVTIYGQNGVDRGLGDATWDQKKLSIIADSDEHATAVALDPLPRPSFEQRENQRKNRRRSRSDTHHDDASDESSHRPLSYMSSAGGYASSYTTRTSFADSDAPNTKDDIRKMVESMRSTYIQALEAREPSRDAIKSLKKKKATKRKSSTPSSTPRASFVPTTPETDRVASMPTTGSFPSLRSQPSTRAVSQPQVAGIPSPPTETPSGQEEATDVGLKRADSATLGALMGESRRSSIKKRASRQNSKRNSISNPRVRASASVKKPTTVEKENVVQVETSLEDEDFAALYKDIFNSNDFWESSPLGSSIDLTTPTTQTNQPQPV